MINLNDFNSLTNYDSKDILYSVESSKMNDGVEKSGIKMGRKGLYTVMVKWVAPILLFLLLLKSLGILTII